MKIKQIYIKNHKIFKNFVLDLTDNGKALNLIVIAGINGSGKTTLFRDFIYRTFQNEVMLKKSYIEVEYIEKQQRKTFKIDFESLRVHNYKGLIKYRKAKKSKYVCASLYHKFKDVVYYEAGYSEHQSAKKIIVQFIDKLIYEEDKKSSEAYLITQNILNQFFNDFDLQIEFKGIDRNREPLFRNNVSEKIKMEELSSGEQELITKAFSIYLADIKDSIILIDEPESSLHPKWQARIVQIYQKIADRKNNQIIFATHSPHIVSSVRKEQIRILVKEDNAIRVIEQFNGSYGWKVDRVLLEIFRTDGLRTPEIEKKLSELKNMIFNDQYETDTFKNLESELEINIGFDDSDLALIRMEVAKRRKMKNEKH
ncbi:AAA family ATPase [Desulfococcaceae bacterium HSG7]|nr:AAA family ATPase [Desulfococcaceae bacterium HSG7]